MPDISTINGVDITTLASFGGVAFADGQTVDGQNVALASDAHELISTSGAISSASSVTFYSSYSEYDIEEYHFINVRPATDNVTFEFQFRAYGNPGYNRVMTTTFFRSYYGATSGLGYQSTRDQTNTYNYQQLAFNVGGQTDEGFSGILRVYGPNTSYGFVKHFQAQTSVRYSSDYAFNNHVAGYMSSTDYLWGPDFRFSSGNIASGEVRRYGILNS